MTSPSKTLGRTEPQARAAHHVIIVRLPVRPGLEGPFLARMAPVIEASHREPGVLAYQLHRGTENTSEFVTYGLFSDHQAFEQHLHSPHVSSWLSELPRWLSDPMVVDHYALHDPA